MSKPAHKSSNKVKVSGVILIDKPIGMTSQQVVSKVKYLFKSSKHNSKKAGHTGTLDPMATGLLPICLGEATKFSHYQLDADKSYQATIRLGQQTDTGDADGTIVAQAAIPSFTQDQLDSIAKEFLGAQQQIPPMYSALKKEGKKLYEYARAGIEVEREPRDIVIKAIELTLIDETHIQLTATCSKGTYIRVLAEDIAKNIGTLGHLIALRRIEVGKFLVAEALTLTQLEDLIFEDRFEQLLPIEACIDIEAELILSADQVKRVQQGQRLNVFEQLTGHLFDYVSNEINKQVAMNKGLQTRQPSRLQQSQSASALLHEIPIDVRLLDEQGDFIGLGVVSLNGRLQPKKLIQL